MNIEHTMIRPELGRRKVVYKNPNNFGSGSLKRDGSLEKVGFESQQTKVATLSAFGLSDAPGVYFLTESQQVVNL